MNFRCFSFSSSNFAFFSATFLLNFCPECATDSRTGVIFSNQSCENKLENCRKLWNLCKLVSIYHYFSFVSFMVRPIQKVCQWDKLIERAVSYTVWSASVHLLYPPHPAPPPGNIWAERSVKIGFRNLKMNKRRASKCFHTPLVWACTLGRSGSVRGRGARRWVSSWMRSTSSACASLH